MRWAFQVMRVQRSCGVLAAALSVLSLASADAQSQRPSLAGAAAPQNAPLVPARPQAYQPDLSAIQLRPDQVDVLRRVLSEAYTHGFEVGDFAPDPAVAL